MVGSVWDDVSFKITGTCCCVLSACSFWLYYPSGYDFGLVGLDFFVALAVSVPHFELTKTLDARGVLAVHTYLFRSSYSVYCWDVTFVVVVAGVGVCRCLGTGNGARCWCFALNVFDFGSLVNESQKLELKLNSFGGWYL